VNISGQVTLFNSSNSRRSQGLSVKLSRSARDISEDLLTPLNDNGSFTIASVGPGQYDVTVEPLPDTFYISSIRYRNAEAMAGFRVDSSPPGRLLIEIAQSDAIAKVLWSIDRSSPCLALRWFWF
jgi:hypothetical protein